MMNQDSKRQITWWLELLRALIAAVAGVLGGAAM